MTRSIYPKWNGTGVARLPNESIASSLLWLGWRNAVRAKDIRFLCTGRKSNSPNQTFLELRWIDSNRIFRETGWKLPCEREKIILDRLQPVQIGWLSVSFRYCPVCLEAGYHSFWYQFKPLMGCPIHHVELTTQCMGCGAETGRYGICNEFFSAPYHCITCGAPLSGGPTQLSANIQLREHAREFERSFGNLNEWALGGCSEWQALSAFAAQNCRLIRGKRIGVPLLCGVAHAMRPLPDRCAASAIGCPVAALPWRLRLSGGTPPGIDDRLSWEERVRTALPVYRVVLRWLREWIARDSTASSAPSNATTVLARQVVFEQSSRIAAYSLLRRRVEGQWFSPSASILDAYIDEPPIPLATSTRRCQRLLCAALYLGMYVDCICAVSEAKRLGTDCGPEFNLRSGLEVFVVRKQIGSYLSGAVIFPKIFEPSGTAWTRVSDVRMALLEMSSDSA